MNWNFLWSTTDGLLLDSNGDGHPDGIAALFIPIDAQECTPAVWAATANLAARLALESPAARLPLVCAPGAAANTVEAWQIPLLLTVRAEPRLDGTPWSGATVAPPLYASNGAQVAWLQTETGRALWIHGATAEALAATLNAMAATAETNAAHNEPLLSSPAKLDLATLYAAGDGGFFAAGPDQFTAESNRHRIVLGPQTDAALGAAAVDLAARLGLESSGLLLPLAVAATEPDVYGDVPVLRLGFGEETERWLEAADGRSLGLNEASARYLAETYPFLDAGSHHTQNEERTLAAITASVRDVTSGHTPLARLSLAETQARRPLHLHATGSDDTANLSHTVFRQEWNPPDGLDNVARVQGAFFEHVIPLLQDESTGESSHGITLFCNAPVPARQALAAELNDALASSDFPIELTVLPAHKAGLAWVRELQLPLLRALEVARVELHFREFKPGDGEKWLDLPHRWLQEIFPADEVLRRELNLPDDDVTVEMMNMRTTDATYLLEAFDAAGERVHRAELRVLWSERLYMAGMPAYGLVHPSSGGMIWQRPDGSSRAWLVPTDVELFWDFYQESVLPAIRQHVLTVGSGRPTPESEPFFDTLAVDGSFGSPDEPLGIYEEFVSVGEALHEDIYFNTLDYLAALGEQFSGRSIEAAGQVLPLIHDYYDAEGKPPADGGPRAIVTLTAPRLPTHLPDLGIVVGDRRDMPQPQDIAVRGLSVDPTGSTVQSVDVSVTYVDAATAAFATRILRRWSQISNATDVPGGVEVSIIPCAGRSPVGRVTISGPATGTPFNEPVSDIRCDSNIIGPAQLDAHLNELAQQPGVRVWRVGRSYQGRPGDAMDVTLPLHERQTHVARRKLALQKPTAFIIARHHANEVASTTAAFALARELTNPDGLQGLLQRINVVFLPMANPDGAAAHYGLMAEHPRWKHHAARFNAAGQEFGRDHFNERTPFGEARFRRSIWSRWLPDVIVDNHGVPSHEWCQPFAGYNSPPRFRVSYHTVQAMLYGIIHYVEDAARPELRTAAEALREAVSRAVADCDWLYARNQYWLARYSAYGHRWMPDVSPVDVHNGMLFYFQGTDPNAAPWRRNFATRHPQITQLEWITEVADETAQGTYLEEVAAAHQIANRAMLQLMADAARPPVRHAAPLDDGRTHIYFRRERIIG